MIIVIPAGTGYNFKIFHKKPWSTPKNIPYFYCQVLAVPKSRVTDQNETMTDKQKSSAGKKRSAGILLYRVNSSRLQVLLVHPGGPFWAKKDAGAWSIPKGEIEEGEDLLDAAKREVEEETGILVTGRFITLTPVKQKSGKIVHAWATEQDVDPRLVKSNLFEMEWPPRSGLKKSFPEIDRAAWFMLEEAKQKIIPGQEPLLEELEQKQDLIKRHL